MAFIIKQNDTLPNLPFRILQPDGTTPQDLTGVDTIDLIVREVSAASTAPPLFKKECSILDQEVEENLGWGFYAWEAADTATAGSFNYEFEIVWEDGGIQTVPADAYLELLIPDDLG